MVDKRLFTVQPFFDDENNLCSTLTDCQIVTDILMRVILAENFILKKVITFLLITNHLIVASHFDRLVFGLYAIPSLYQTAYKHAPHSQNTLNLSLSEFCIIF